MLSKKDLINRIMDNFTEDVNIVNELMGLNLIKKIIKKSNLICMSDPINSSELIIFDFNQNELRYLGSLKYKELESLIYDKVANTFTNTFCTLIVSVGLKGVKND